MLGTVLPRRSMAHQRSPNPWILLVRCYLPQTVKVDQAFCLCEYELCLRLLMAGRRFLFCPHVGAVCRRWSDATLSRRDGREVARQLARIIDRAEEFLTARGELTDARRWAVDRAPSTEGSSKQGDADPARDHAERLAKQASERFDKVLRRGTSYKMLALPALQRRGAER